MVKYNDARAEATLSTWNMPGEHNQSNAAAALAVVDALIGEGTPLNRTAAVAAIEEFGGLPHRLQWVHSFDIPIGGAGTRKRGALDFLMIQRRRVRMPPRRQ